MITREQRKIELMGDLVNFLDKELRTETKHVEFGDWPSADKILLDGRVFSFHNHEYLVEPYHDYHPYQVEIKATQLGLTSKALLRVVHSCRYGDYRGILYLFPSRTDVTDLSKTRLTPLIEENPDTIGRWLSDTDSANVKKIWNSFLYLRGMKSRIGIKSIPIDFEVFDELDEAPQNAVDMALERMAHSEHGDLLFLSNPTLPDYGIDKLFQETDQRFWLLKCRKCNEYTDMVSTFPDCLREVKGRVIRACIKCGAELDPNYGEWVAKRPSITSKRGRQFSQLYSSSRTNSPEAILHKFRTTDNLTDFYNLKIGIAYVDSANRLSMQEVFSCCGDTGMSSSSDTGCFMGVDQGSNLHVVIGRHAKNRAGEIIFITVLKGNNESDKADESGWFELDELMNRFRVMRCVVDALPNTKFARNFSDRFRGRVFLNYYNDHQRGSYRWNEKDMVSQCNRTESLDSSHREITTNNIILPRKSDMLITFAEHMHNVAKRLEVDDESGSQRYVYHRLGPDHFRHAFNYESMARNSSPELLFPEVL
jgi:hypothetical protein